MKEVATNGVVRVFHLTTLVNLDSILEEGVLSRERAIELHPNFKDIASQGALHNHSDALVGEYPVDNYARCFFNPLSPMYHNRVSEGIKDLCIVEIHIPFVRKKGRTRFFDNLKVEGVPWNETHMFRESIASLSKKGSEKDFRDAKVGGFDWIHWNPEIGAFRANPDRTIACRGAELLVLNCIPAKYIAQVYSELGIEGHHPISELEPLYDAGRPAILEDEK